MDANTTALVCVSCLKPARYVCKKCYDIFIGPDKKPGMRHRLDHVGRYCSRECQINHWILIHAATHDIWDRAEESAVGGSIDSYPLPACTTLHKRPKSDPERDIEEQTRLLGDTLAFFRDKLEDLSVVLWNTPTLKAGGSFDRPDIRSAMWAMANVPLLLRESDARAAKKPMDEASARKDVPNMIFFQNPKHVLSTARTDEENRLHAIHVQAANKFEAIMEDEKYTADRALRAVLPLVPELATAYKIHLNPRHQYVLGVVRRLLEDEEFSSGYGQFKVRIDPSCSMNDHDGEAIPSIVIYCSKPVSDDFTPEKTLSIVMRIFSDISLRDKALISMRSSPRFSARVDPLIWWVNGDGDVKRALQERISAESSFEKVRAAIYNPDMTAFLGYELVAVADEQPAESATKPRAPARREKGRKKKKQ